MNKYLRIIFILVCIILFGIILSPFVSLVLPEKLTNHTYYRLIYSVIAKRETAACRNNQEKVLRLFSYVINHEFMQGEAYSCKPAESLIYGQALCDFQARTLNALLSAARIPSRSAMLLDKEGNSPHTLNEVYLKGKWCVFDPSLGIIFKDNKGDNLSLEELSNSPGLIYKQKKLTALAALKEHNRRVEYENFVKPWPILFPIPLEPRRSTPLITQGHILDYVADTYFKLFKYNFFNLYQDLYLRLKKNYLPPDAKVFFQARNYHLGYRWPLALRYYNMLLQNFPASNYIPDTVFFLGTLYFDKKDFPSAVKYFNIVLEKYLQKWGSAGNYYLGRCFEIMGDKEASMQAFSKTSIYKLSEQIIEEFSSYKLNKP